MELREIPRMLSPASSPHPLLTTSFSLLEKPGSEALFGCKFLWWQGSAAHLLCHRSGLEVQDTFCFKQEASDGRTQSHAWFSVKCHHPAFPFAKSLWGSTHEGLIRKRMGGRDTWWGELVQKVGSTLQRSAQKIGQRVSLPEKWGPLVQYWTVLGWIEVLLQRVMLCVFCFLYFFLWKEEVHSGPSYIELRGALNILTILFNVHTQLVEYHCSHLTDRWAMLKFKRGRVTNPELTSWVLRVILGVWLSPAP